MKQHRPKQQRRPEASKSTGKTNDKQPSMSAEYVLDEMAGSRAGDNRIGGAMTWFQELCQMGQGALPEVADASNSIKAADGSHLMRTADGWVDVVDDPAKAAASKGMGGAAKGLGWAGRVMAPAGVWDAAGGLGEVVSSETMDTGERAVKGIESGLAFAGSALGVAEGVAVTAGALTGGAALETGVGAALTGAGAATAGAVLAAGAGGVMAGRTFDEWVGEYSARGTNEKAEDLRVSSRMGDWMAENAGGAFLAADDMWRGVFGD